VRKYFKGRNKRAVDNAGSGRRSSAVTGVNIDKAEQLKEDRRLSLRELYGSQMCHWKGFTTSLHQNRA
jgi:hypothetical protein